MVGFDVRVPVERSNDDISYNGGTVASISAKKRTVKMR